MPPSSSRGLLTLTLSRHAHGPRFAHLVPLRGALKDGQHDFCFVRKNVDGKLELLTYGHSIGFCIDPVEKKPLNHFYPGTSVLSFGTAGCNLGCKFCQAWEITKSREVLHLLSQHATPQVIARAAKELGCKSVSFTYNDPVIWADMRLTPLMSKSWEFAEIVNWT